MAKQAVRVGIDVGGTHTKAVAIANATHEILGKASVMTTHDHEMGVSQGIVEAFRKCLAESAIDSADVVFIAHSTTQATNALLEGDVATVGVLGMGRGMLEGFLAKRQTRIPDIPLVTGRKIPVRHTYLDTKRIDAGAIRRALEELRGLGGKVIVASMAFGVDRADEERMVMEIAGETGMPVTVASDISKLYGLTVRTRTAAINASILPKMLETAESIESSVRKSGISVPLMIMRGDGGVMELSEMKKRPVLTMLSGPAASVVGALMYLRASNGIYFEVGGTSTNIGVIKNGRPAVEYATLGGHRTYVSSLDVRVLGVAGGSMVRAGPGGIVDVGPRSAHIAGLPYAAFTPEEEMRDPVLEFVRPKPEDPADYAVVRVAGGKRVAITNTCAANVLGLATEEMFAHGNRASCLMAMAVLAKGIGKSVEETATAILDKSCDKIQPVIEDLARRYKLEREQMVLVGVGGGAGALLPFAAKRMDLPFSIPVNAEVISSIGVALSMVRDVVERVIPNPGAEDIAKIKQEAILAAVASGADPEGVEVQIEIDPVTQKVTAIALGSTEVRTTDLLKEVCEEEAKDIAAKSFGVDCGEVVSEGGTGGVRVFSVCGKDGHRRIRVVDKKGFVKVQRSAGKVVTATAGTMGEALAGLWGEMISFAAETVIAPDVYLCVENRVVDCSGMLNCEQARNVLSAETMYLDPDREIILIAVKNVI